MGGGTVASIIGVMMLLLAISSRSQAMVRTGKIRHWGLLIKYPNYSEIEKRNFKQRTLHFILLYFLAYFTRGLDNYIEELNVSCSDNNKNVISFLGL